MIEQVHAEGRIVGALCGKVKQALQHKEARQIVERHQGQFPRKYGEIRALPGVGPYTAAAIASFAYDAPYPVLDGNVKRVISRLFGIDAPIDGSAGLGKVQAALDQVFDPEHSARFNQAVMDFGALLCTPRAAGCASCPFASQCKALQTGMVDLLPVKGKKTERRTRYFHFFIVTIDGQLVLRKRTGKDIWQGLFEPLMHETEDDGLLQESDQLTVLSEFLDWNGDYRCLQTENGRQLLSHQDIRARFYRYVFEDARIAAKSDVELVNPQNLSNFALPKVVDWYLNDFSIT